jgi:hypothetical protein
MNQLNEVTNLLKKEGILGEKIDESFRHPVTPLLVGPSGTINGILLDTQ